MPVSTAYQCYLTVLASAAYQCPSVPPHQCPSVPPISAHYCSLISAQQ
ncbi:unnamed protein product [Staurois parvus]|uniref:Uncharacterized protein n=1 Tax=Staurois parvus TaxID=386267 RepID=A0ABN9B6R0_9NEOB|nr:unnamed protein product [Staurois parvus]